MVLGTVLLTMTLFLCPLAPWLHPAPWHQKSWREPDRGEISSGKIRAMHDSAKTWYQMEKRKSNKDFDFGFKTLGERCHYHHLCEESNSVLFKEMF